jgi:hypothetical protein
MRDADSAAEGFETARGMKRGRGLFLHNMSIACSTPPTPTCPATGSMAARRGFPADGDSWLRAVGWEHVGIRGGTAGEYLGARFPLS